LGKRGKYRFCNTSTSPDAQSRRMLELAVVWSRRVMRPVVATSSVDTGTWWRRSRMLMLVGARKMSAAAAASGEVAGQRFRGGAWREGRMGAYMGLLRRVGENILIFRWGLEERKGEP
jgi:hypothetical protein